MAKFRKQYLNNIKKRNALAYSKAWYVRERVGDDFVTTQKTLDYLSHDVSDIVRAAVASNRHTHPATLAFLANDNDLQVRYCVAYNPKTLLSVIEQLADDPDEPVRQCAAHNSSLTSIKTIIKLRKEGLDICDEQTALYNSEIDRLRELNGLSKDFPASWIEKSYLL